MPIDAYPLMTNSGTGALDSLATNRAVGEFPTGGAVTGDGIDAAWEGGATGGDMGGWGAAIAGGGKVEATGAGGEIMPPGGVMG